MITLEQCPEGLVLAVRARAGARSNELRGAHNGALIVSVTQVAEKGKANKAIVAVLAKALGLKKSQVVLFSGETNPHKQFLLINVEREKITSQLNKLLS